MRSPVFGPAGSQAALAKTPPANMQIYAAVLVLDRLQTLNVRFGRQVGDEVLRAFAKTVRKQLISSDVPVGAVQRWWRCWRAGKRERRPMWYRGSWTRRWNTVVTSSRSLMLPISARWSVFRWWPHPPVVSTDRYVRQRAQSPRLVGQAVPPAMRSVSHNTTCQP